MSATAAALRSVKENPEVDVVIEIPRGSFLKRGSSGHVDFISPLPCPFNYGAVPTLLGLEGDLLDVVVLGRRLRVGTRLRLPARGAVVQRDRGMVDHKLICSVEPLDDATRRSVLRFFRFYARSKGLLNLVRGQPGRNACEGWIEAREALACAKPRDASWRGSTVRF
jgi:inorganic pyrophosphatase